MAIVGKIGATTGNLERDFAVIRRNLQIQIAAIERRTHKGLIMAAINVRWQMKISPMIPVDLANLKASWFIATQLTADPIVTSLQVKGGSFKAGTPTKVLTKLNAEHPQTVEEVRGELNRFPKRVKTTAPIAVGMGFSAFYAAAVHEMGVSGATAGKPIKWSLAGSGPKFFQAALYRSTDEMVKIVQTNAMVKL